MRRDTRTTIWAILLSLALGLASLPQSERTLYAQSAPPSPTQGKAPVYLPFLTVATKPDFAIINPFNGSTVSGTLLFAVQPLYTGSISQVSFKAGTKNLEADATPANGFQTFLDLGGLPDGPLQLTATATGPGGAPITKSINVVVTANPPASAAVDADGAILATATGSTISVPPGAVGGSVTVSVQDKTQPQVTAEEGIEWDDLGVTFLGAIDVQTSGTISKPLGVSSVGFGQRVQTGQAVVTYRILPDADGDGAGELVVVNGANLAPNGTIVSSPVPEILINSISVGAAAQMAATSGVQLSLSGPPGTVIRIEGSGFNSVSAQGNIARFQSLVNGKTLEVPAAVSLVADNPALQTLTTVIPPLAAGAATLTLRNESSAAVTGPINITVEAAARASSAAGEVLDDFWAKGITFVSGLTATQPGAAAYRDQLGNKFTELRTLFQQLDQDPKPEVKQYIADMAVVVQNSGLLDLGAMIQSITPQKQSPQEKAILDLYVAVLGVITAGGAAVILAGGGAAAFPILAPVLVGIGIGIALIKLYQAAEDALNPCGPSLIAQLANAISGMGSAAPSGGNGCGNATGGASGSVQSAALSLLSNGRYSIKIFSREEPPRRLTPFTGATDPGGYFFIPLIPAGEPFRALALDNLTGAAATFEGVGPAIGESVVMYFDFSDAVGNRYDISIGDTITNGVPGPGAGNIEEAGGLDIYTFEGTANQRIYLDLFGVDPSMAFINWKLIAPNGDEIFNHIFNCCGGSDAGRYTLPQTGIYTLRVGADDDPSTGLYGFTLWNVPPAPVVAIAVGDTITDGTPIAGVGNLETPGSQDTYTFTAAPNQRVYFDAFGVANTLSQASWILTAPDGEVIFDKILNCCGGIDAGRYTLVQGGTYTITIEETNSGATGKYGFTLWNVPPAPVVNIAVGDTITDGAPIAGVGNLETPGSQDIYTFDAVPNQRVFFDAFGVANTLAQARWTLIAADDAVLFDRIFNCCGGIDAGTYTLVQGGTYTIRVEEVSGGATGKYGFTLWNVPDADEFAITVGQNIANGVPGPGAGNIETPGAQDIYTFTPVVGQSLTFDFSSAAATLAQVNWKLVAPNNEVVFDSIINCCGGSDQGPFTLNQNGVYRLTVGEDRDGGTGIYSFSIHE